MSNANIETVAEYLTNARRLHIPNEVQEAAKKCLVDWCSVALGAQGEPAQQATRRSVLKWQSKGKAQILLGGTSAPAVTALINGTMSHCLDYDDTHVASLAHLSSPTWSTALALGSHLNADEDLIVRAFIVGFETGARLGSGGIGEASNRRGWHSTGIFGCLGAVATASILLGLDYTQIRNAFGAAATQIGGITGSFGTMSKPFHAGKAAFNAILAAELAAEGFESKTDLLEIDGELAHTLIQDSEATFNRLDYSDGWEILNNTFKPYASCLLTHPAIDVARDLSRQIKNHQIEKIEVDVNPLCQQLAGKTHPISPLEGKFSTAFCVALALSGRRAIESDFNLVSLQEPELRNIAGRVSLNARENVDPRAGQVTVHFTNGRKLKKSISVALGNPGNPMTWNEIKDKYSGLVKPVLGNLSEELFECLTAFTEPGSRDRFCSLVSMH